MADIFLAYSRSNSKKADKFKSALEDQGYSVFVDIDTPTGERWREHIERQLRECKIVIVLWSKTSVKSDFVKEEADVAKQYNKLYPVMITKCDIPYGFRSIQTLNLSSWNGDTNSPKWKRLLIEIKVKLKK